MLCRHPEISCHVQKLVVKPEDSYRDQLSRYAHPDGLAVCSIIRQVAVRLDALNTFVWDTVGFPPDDDMWFMLQKL